MLILIADFLLEALSSFTSKSASPKFMSLSLSSYLDEKIWATSLFSLFRSDSVCNFNHNFWLHKHYAEKCVVLDSEEKQLSVFLACFYMYCHSHNKSMDDPSFVICATSIYVSQNFSKFFNKFTKCFFQIFDCFNLKICQWFVYNYQCMLIFQFLFYHCLHCCRLVCHYHFQ